jgi:hypothetical protein
MITREQFIDFLQTINIYHPSARMDTEKLNKEFDFQTFDCVVYMEENKDKLTEKEWRDIYHSNKNNPLITLQIVMLGKAPIDIIEEMLLNLPVLNRDNVAFFHVEQLILLESFKYNISESVIEKLFGDGEEFPYPYLHSAYDTVDEIKKHFLSFNINPLKSLCEKYIQYYNEDDFEYLGEAIEFYDIFRYIPDKSYIEDLITREEMSGFLPEIIKTNLINNEFLNPDDPKDEELMNRIFESGCIHSQIKKFTPHIAKSCTDIAYSSYINSANSNMLFYSGNLLAEEKQVLNNLITQNLLPEAYEYDLGQRFVTANIDCYSEIIANLFSHTTNKNLIKEISSLNSVTKTEALLKNPNIDKETAVGIISDFVNDFRLGKVFDINATRFITLICMLANKFELKEDNYWCIFNNLSLTVDFEDFASCLTVPENVLEEIIKNTKTLSNPQNKNPRKELFENVKIIAKINLFSLKNHLPQELTTAMTDIIKKNASVITTASEYERKYTVTVPNLTGHTSKTHQIPSTLFIGIPCENFQKVINNYTVDEINAMFKIIENYKDNELDEQLDEAEYAFFEFFISLKEQALKDKYFVKYPDEKEIETISDENLEEILEREVRIFASPLLSGAFLPSTLDAYLELNKIIKAHTLAKSEFLKRGFSFPNVKLQDINLEKNNQEPHPNQITDMDGVCVENNQR